MPHLEIRKKGRRRSRFFVFNGEVVTIGRSSRNALVLHDNAVSREHCVIDPTVQGPIVRDLNSTRGIQVNESSVLESPLQDGDCVRIGPYSLYYRLDDVPGFGERRVVAPSNGSAHSNGSPVAIARAGRAESIDDEEDGDEESGLNDKSAEFEPSGPVTGDDTRDHEPDTDSMLLLRAELAAVRQELADRDARVQELEALLNDVRADSDEQRTQSAAAHEAECEALRESLRQSGNELLARDREIQRLAQELRTQEKLGEEFERTFQVTERETARLRQQHEAESNSFRTALEQARTEKVQIEKELAAFQAKLTLTADHAGALAASESEKAALAERIRALKEQVTAAEKRAAELQKSASLQQIESARVARQFEVDIEQVQLELAARAERISELEAERTAATSELEQAVAEARLAAEQRVKSLQAEIENAHESHKTEIAKLRSEIADRASAHDREKRTELELDRVREEFKAVIAQHAAERDRLESEYAESIRLLEENLASRSRELQDRTEELATQVHAREMREAEVVQLAGQVKRAADEHSESVRALREEFAAREAEWEKSRQLDSGLRERISELESQLQEVETERDELSRRANELQRNHDAETAAKKEAEKNSASSLAERDELANQVRELHSLLTAANGRIAEFESRAVADHDSHHQLQVRLDSVGEEREALILKLHDAEQSLHAATARSSQLERAISEHQASQQHLAIENSNLADKIAELSQEIERLRNAAEDRQQQENVAAAEGSREFDAQISDLQDSLRDRDDALASLRERISSLEKRRDEAMVDAQSARATVIELRRDIAHLKAALDEKDEALSAIQRGDYEEATPATRGELATVRQGDRPGAVRADGRDREVMAQIFGGGSSKQSWRTSVDRDWGSILFGGLAALLVLAAGAAGVYLYLQN